MAKTKRTELKSSTSKKAFTSKRIQEIIKAFGLMGIQKGLLKEHLNSIAHKASNLKTNPLEHLSAEQLSKVEKKFERALKEINSLNNVECSAFNTRINQALNSGCFTEKVDSIFSNIKKVRSPHIGQNTCPHFDYQPIQMLNDIKEKIIFIQECLKFDKRDDFQEDRIVLPKKRVVEKKNDKLFDFIVDKLCFVWEILLFQKITTTVNYNDSSSGGRLVMFIAEFCKTIGVTKSPHAIRDAIRKGEKARTESSRII